MQDLAELALLIHSLPEYKLHDGRHLVHLVQSFSVMSNVLQALGKHLLNGWMNKRVNG